MPWIKPVVQNQWGKITYHEWAGERTCHPVLYGPRIEAGSYRVRWPDGTETEEALRAQPYHTTVGDHGHAYDISSERLILTITHKGISMTPSLESLNVELWIDHPEAG